MRVIYAVAFFSLISLNGYAKTWEVRLDGSGDFVSVQDAIDQCSSGDVVDIGPGVFLGEPYGDRSAAVGHWGGSRKLVIRGAGADLTTLTGDGQRRVEFGFDIDGGSVEVQDLTITGVQWSIYCANTELTLRRVTIRDCDHGVYTTWGKAKLLDSRFISSPGMYTYGMRCNFSSSEAVRVRRNVFTNSYIYVALCPDVDIAANSFDELTAIIMKRSTGALSDNVIDFGNWLRSVHIEDSVTALRDNRIVGGEINLTVSGPECKVEAVGNLFSNGRTSNFYLYNGAQLKARGNDIYRSDDSTSLFVEALNYFGPDIVEINMNGNYWGGDFTDDEIHQYIHDLRDSTDRLLRVDVGSVMTETVEAPPMNFGDLKALFR